MHIRMAAFLGAICAWLPAQAVEPVPVGDMAPAQYEQQRAGNAVVLVSVMWGRKWNCAGFENVQLLSLSFERMPEADMASVQQGPPTVLELKTPSRLFVDKVYTDYAFILPPGSYAMSGFDLKTARSTTDVGGIKSNRAELLKDGVPRGGSFEVFAGEVVYIGHFFLDCTFRDHPMPWRYYADGRDGFSDYLGKIRKEFPAIDSEHVRYGLFKTTAFGEAYELPEETAQPAPSMSK